MKRQNALLYCSLAIISLCICSFTNNNWVLFRKSNYSILFPNEPSTDSTTKNTQIGAMTVYNHMYETPENVTDSNLLYGLSVTDYPSKYVLPDNKAFMKGFFEGVVNGAVNGVPNGKLLDEKDITIKNYPGKEIKIDYDNGTAIIHMKIILVRERVFALQTICLPGHEINTNATKFYSSFDFK